MWCLSLPINLIQNQHKLPSLVFGPRSKTLFQQHRQRTDMLTSTLAKLFPLIPLSQGLEGIPKDLGQEVSTCNAFAAADNCVRYLEI